jgi:hypothetical protein
MKTIRNILLLLSLTLSGALLQGCSDDDPATPSQPAGPTVLVLSDGGSEDHVTSTLKAAGFRVRDGGLFHEFTGGGLAGVDAVVLLAGVDYSHDMDDAGEAALVAFVKAGGGLLNTEWLNYSISQSKYHQVLKSILPVNYGGAYGSGNETYTVLLDHAVTKDLPATFSTKAGTQYSVLSLKSGAFPLIRGSRSGTAVCSWTQGGRVISWNMAGEYGQGDVWTADLDRLLVNATGYVSNWDE